MYFFTKIQASLRSLSSSEKCMGLSGLEPPTSRLSGVRSNRLSYKPLLLSFSSTIISLRSMRCTCFLTSDFAKKCCGNTIASLRYARCAIFLNSNFALLVLIKKNMQRHPPTLPYRLQYSTIGRPGLNHRVRNGNGCLPRPHRHR